MFKIRKQFAGAMMGTLLGFAGAGGGCDPMGLSSLNSLLDTLDSWESDYGYYDSYDSYDGGYDNWNQNSPGWDLLDIKSG